MNVHRVSLLPILRTKLDLIFAAYPELNNYSLSRPTTIEELNARLKHLWEVENSANIFTKHKWRQLNRSDYNNFRLELEPQGDSEFVLKQVQGSVHVYAQLEQESGIVTLTGNTNTVLNVLGLRHQCRPNLDWPINAASLTIRRTNAKTRVEEMLGDTSAALELILSN